MTTLTQQSRKIDLYDELTLAEETLDALTTAVTEDIETITTMSTLLRLAVDHGNDLEQKVEDLTNALLAIGDLPFVEYLATKKGNGVLSAKKIYRILDEVGHPAIQWTEYVEIPDAEA